MTIFLKIIRDYLVNELTDYIANSASSDKSFINLISRKLLAGREAQLSIKKRAIASQLIHTLNNLDSPLTILPETKAENEADIDTQEEKAEPFLPDSFKIAMSIELSQDTVTIKKIITLLKEAKETAKNASEALDYDEGTFGPLIVDIINVVSAFLEKVTDMQLLDIQDDFNPYNKFCYHMATYLFKNTLAELHPSAFAKITSNPKITNSRKLTKEKETLVQQMIKLCKDDLETLDKSHPKYAQTRYIRVLEHIEELKRQNIGKVNEYGVNLTIPIRLAFFSIIQIDAPKLGPEAGTLHECLTNAENDIKKDIESLAEQHISACLN